MSWTDYHHEPIRVLDIQEWRAEFNSLNGKILKRQLFNYVSRNWANNMYTNKAIVQELLVEWFVILSKDSLEYEIAEKFDFKYTQKSKI